MSLIFSKKLALSNSQLRAQEAQWLESWNMQTSSEKEMEVFLELTGNSGRSPADAFREFDATTKEIQNSAGEFATSERLMQVSRSIDLGREVFEYRRASSVDGGQSSMTGQIGIKMDHVDYSYAGTVVPIHDAGYGRRYREVLAMRADAFDANVDDARECELTIRRHISKYLWDGNAALSMKGFQWLGLRNDPSVISATLGPDLADNATSATDIQNEIRRLRDILRISNKCLKDLRLGVSQEIMTNWEKPVSLSEIGFSTILAFVQSLRGIIEVYEDSELVDNQVVMYWGDQQGLHPVTGMALSSYAVPRTFHNDDFNFIKWAAVGFISKTDFNGNKCALYGE